ncbi:hypothetical protein [Bradyrhizobium sp. Ce-3]|uniref:hypothetical protein n=1 Tax=Bradyrhizobium sp. Ce-3 TaxID=2913970 RepID=UPI001FC89719|nr:hypothetical protein [Bradyrhizobium sp. Ce-3]GKQ54310.1 hypothetical protein BRSPCE3_51650 [Bradyrhizobium sp. Ce-3]
MEQFVTALSETFNLVLASSSTAILSAVGLFLLLLTAMMAYLAVKSKPDELSTFVKVSLFVCLFGGMLFSASGPALALFYVSQNPIKTKSVDKSFDDLTTNARVDYVVRLIAYDPVAHPELSIDRLKRLGPSQQEFSFVADYNELRGYTVREALEKIGASYTPGQYVSAIIFPLKTRLYPANARGLIQIVSEVEGRGAIDLKDRFFSDPGKLDKDQVKDIKNHEIWTYKLDNFKDLYPRYCKLAQAYFCGAFASRDMVGGLYPDWHPLGFSQKNPPADPCQIAQQDFCEFTDWKQARAKWHATFGSRAFLIANLEIEHIPGRMLFYFDDPDRNVIPDIGAR